MKDTEFKFRVVKTVSYVNYITAKDVDEAYAEIERRVDNELISIDEFETDETEIELESC